MNDSVVKRFSYVVYAVPVVGSRGFSCPIMSFASRKAASYFVCHIDDFREPLPHGYYPMIHREPLWTIPSLHAFSAQFKQLRKAYEVSKRSQHKS